MLKSVTKNSILITSTASNQGKTLLTTALLYHYKARARAFKIGPDYIDPLFHRAITKRASINLDGYMMNESQIKWLYNKYADESISILEGVMGYYDGMDKGASSYDIANILNIPSILILDASGTYITIVAIIKGIKEYRKNSNIKAIVLNKISSNMHYNLIKNKIEEEFDDIVVLGWIQKDLDSLESIHLGLDLEQLDNTDLESLSNAVLEHIDLKLIETISSHTFDIEDHYPFEKIYINKRVAIVNDKNFSFLYHDNVEFLKESFADVVFVSAVDDETIDEKIDIVYIPGGYVETDIAYDRIKNSTNFKDSLVKHSKTKPIYAECAGMILLSNSIDDKSLLGILDISFKMQDKRARLGYYEAKDIDTNISYKGHAFHYSDIDRASGEFILLTKSKMSRYGGYRDGKIVGTYLHSMFRSETNIIKEYFDV
jgi:cobyrinic acid a,c-diamide synthase